MQIRNSAKTKFKNNELIDDEEVIVEKKVDINILLNRVKIEQKDKIKKKFSNYSRCTWHPCNYRFNFTNLILFQIFF